MAGFTDIGDRARRTAALLIALGVGLVAYALVSLGGGGESEQGTERVSATSEPTVLGAVVTRALPAAPAAPVVSLEADEPAESPTRPSRPPTTFPPPTLIPATVIENTTTTVDIGVATSIVNTTTTSPTTTTTDPSTTNTSEGE